ncbi:MAG: DUF1926 domain-containing protein [Promethearchaeota archaeon]|nr:MAG: DUF1926 domain-containing protein [Candidatus Lokiarchaeota archaeon]
MDKNISELLEDEQFTAKTIQVYAKQNDVKLKITLDNPTEIFKYSLFTFAKTNGGDDTLYQGTVLALKTPIKLEAGTSINWKLNISFE